MSGETYYYPLGLEEEATAPPGVEIECFGGTITLTIDTDREYPAQVVEMTHGETMRLAGALNRAEAQRCGEAYYYPLGGEEEATAPPGVVVECFETVTIAIDIDREYPPQVADLTTDEVMCLTGALNRAALCALPEVEQ